MSRISLVWFLNALLIDDVLSMFYDEQSVVVVVGRLRVLVLFAVVEEEYNHLLGLIMMLMMEMAKLKERKKNNENFICRNRID